MKVLRCLLADDEPIARQILENYIEDIPNLELIASCKNAFEVMEVLEKETIDVMFLDINMPKLSGISLLKSIKDRPEVIITTAYPEYAIEGFELSVTDYLLKPFSLERFLQAVTKVRKKTMVTQPSISPVAPKEQSLFVKSDKKTIKLNLEEITHVEAYGNYIKIFTDEMILTPLTLSEFLEKLSDDFIRIHKSYVVNFYYLKLIDGNQFVLRNNVKLPIGKSYRKLVSEKIGS
ncbi:LytTR family DNA-binding domain-containing protein [uncultured Tenacibaculum sp.]|uniref:LytR/AlgR family response regulator transcription factor n=1 Tax=uncultured Tenacibaculum sp. TaxID=174713 RepID=UPI0026016A25|nr:LytTR family DNA-binding domain-containing protein [uncultured Tenacibaculum sp.]